MRFSISVLILNGLLNLFFGQAVIHEKEIVARIFGGDKIAKKIAGEFGYVYRGPVHGFIDTYLLIEAPEEHSSYSKRGGRSTRLADDERVLWADSQKAKSRQKRDLIDSDAVIRRPYRSGVVKRPIPPLYDHTFNDALWSQQWYMHDTRTLQDLPKLDLNVLSVYKRGITGRGVRVCIIDDGIEYTHADLRKNYDPEISYDYNDEDSDPLPRYDKSLQNSHGTRCAGEVAMTANNKKCGVGIAYNAIIGGVKVLDGLINDRLEGSAIGFGHKLIDIYSASWGPDDDGKTVEGPGRLSLEAIERGIKEGRNGKGCIYVWASGNGGQKNDNCNCDGYVASPYTISVGSASERGEFPWYGETCASTLAVTYSSGAYQDQMIVTTDLHNKCTIKHTGTSASAPLAAGIIALGLEANPNLTWRDVQHIIVWTSEFAPVANNKGWLQNAAGLWFNTRFGFGLMNGFGFVNSASNWTMIAKKYICTAEYVSLDNTTITYGNPLIVSLEADGCKGTSDVVNFLEHVEVTTTITYNRRGSLEIFLTSPSGTKVQILAPRSQDNSTEGFNHWTFMSVATWGENPEGVWILTINDNIGPNDNKGSLKYVTLTLHGTKELPKHMRNGQRIYNKNYNRLHNRFINDKKTEESDDYVDLIADALKQFYGYV